MTTLIAVIGPGLADAGLGDLAERVGALLAAEGATVVCGGLGGVMEAVCRGARRAGGSTIGILPGDDRRAANPYVEIALPTGLGEARNVLVARVAHAVIAIGGAFGTLSELALARKLGIPVIGLQTWRLEEPGRPRSGIVHVGSAEDAVRHAIRLARQS